MVPIWMAWQLCVSTTPTILSRKYARTVLEEHVLPATEYGRRIRLGRKNQTRNGKFLMHAQDPRLFQTYGEFPLDSLDRLLDRALELCTKEESLLSKTHATPLTVVDLGSGCGRLALYMALTRPHWDVHGMELSLDLHREALDAQERAIQGGWLQKQGDGFNNTTTSSLCLHHGAACEFPDLLQQADLIFCYSTAFESSGFSQETSSMLLSNDWNELVSSHCADSIVITTDKSLDSRWKILDRMDVPNPEVWESTGFIHQYRTQRTAPMCGD